MKKLVTKKTAALLVFMMMVSALSPILLFAASGIDGKTKFVTESTYYDGSGTIAGNVYVAKAVYDEEPVTSGVYATDSVYKNRVTINVYEAGKVAPRLTVDATYSRTSNLDGYYAYGYSFNNVSTSTYSFPLKLQYTYGTDTITTFVYEPSNNGGGGNLPWFPGVPGTGGDIVGADGKVNRDLLIAALKADENARIKTTTDTVYLPADALLNGKTLTIFNDAGVSITLPLAALKLADLAKSLGVELKDLVIRVEMKKLTGDAAKAVNDAVKAVGATQLADAYDFKVVAVGGGKELPIEKFGQLVQRTIPLTSAATSNAAGVLFNPTAKELSFVPSTFAKVDDKTIATLKRDGSSIYTVIQGKTARFNDALPFWSKNAIESLSEKLIVEGTGKNLFEPKRGITRAEFAALVTRSLGVQPVTSTTYKFNDVVSTKWYAGTVAAAAEIGLVIGDDKGNFNPNAPITRKEVAAIVVRATEYAGKSIKLSDANANAALAGFKDTAILGWAKAEVAAAVKAGIVNGQSSTTIAGNAFANRAEAATMIARYLPIAGLSN
ncbi:S-layer homology domain-containing protein [Paenibacillus albicereus]|uniref:S-layer homology domain-containing protein n=1 Tax=Paenibacillus albicereus TaxID=2726185 RepID=A0A6H2H3G5_9BACL|nr:S-layer homology domain-containing protein [Paenibacillus albicereus]QJC53878.1 S-layer homology domain-containing protein [Paenibacillus albicereus]